MKYWFYSDGNILGPYTPNDLVRLPAFSSGSLVCRENSTGDNSDDWKSADAVAEITEVLSVGVGQILSSDNSYVSDAYSLETGFSSRETQKFFESKNEEDASGDFLDTIDNILGECSGGSAKDTNKIEEVDYGLADKFDIRLSKIKEELEAAKWEKNLLLEKMKTKEAEEKRNRLEIQDLKNQLRNAIASIKSKYAVTPDITESVPAEIERAEEKIAAAADFEKTEEPMEDFRQPDEYEKLRKEEEAINAEFAEDVSKEKAPEPDIKTPPEIKGRHISERVSDHILELKKLSHKIEDISGTEHISSNKLKSLGRAKSKGIFDDNDDAKAFKPEIPEPVKGEAKVSNREHLNGKALEGEPKKQTEELSSVQKAEEETVQERKTEEVLDIQPSAMVYDFTAVTSNQPPIRSEKVNITIEENKREEIKAEAKAESAEQAFNPPSFDDKSKSKKTEFPPTQIKITPEPSLVPNLSKDAALSSAPVSFASISPGLKPVSEEKAIDEETKFVGKPDVKKEERAGDKTERILISPVKKDKPAVNEKPQKAKLRKSGMFFIIVIVIFGAIVSGGLGFFFFSDSLSLADFSLMGTLSKKKASAPGLPVSAKKTKPLDISQSVSARPAAIKIAAPSANENIRKAIKIAKNHKLAGGRGIVSTWLSNSFLAGSSINLNEDWSATILHKNIFVAQYRLLRQRKEPVVYQFEVDVEKGAIVRGINNNAMELLDFPSKKKIVKKPVSKKPAKTKKPQKKKLRELPQLSLPKEPLDDSGYKEPSGFENVTIRASDKVKYIVAQESDENLF